VDGVLTVVAPPAASSDQPSARVVDGGLLILGTTGADRVLVAPLGNNQVRVRAGNQILGTFAAPSSIALDLLGGQDYAYVAPSVAPAVVATSADSATDDAIFGGRNSLVVDDQDSWAAVLNDFRHGASAADQRAARDLALLELATQWSTQPASSTSRGVSRLLG
jgi:hypothetical protein